MQEPRCLTALWYLDASIHYFFLSKRNRLPRQELVGILNMPRNKRIRKAGLKESHLVSIVDVYRGVVFNALARIEEDEAGDAGPLAGAKPQEKGVRVSLFAATLGVSPYLFMREVSRGSDRIRTASTRYHRDVRLESVVEERSQTPDTHIRSLFCSSKLGRGFCV